MKNERLIELISYLKENRYVYNSADFATQIGQSKSYITGLRNGHVPLTENVISRIVKTFPFVNEEWLSNGSGDMINENAMIPSNEKEGIPLVDIETMAGILSGETFLNKNDFEYYNIPHLGKADFLITVSGDSMSPTIKSGDVLAIKIMPSNDMFFKFGDIYMLDTIDGVLVKRIKQSEKEDCIKIVSDNKDEYEPYDMSKNRINRIALVLGLVRSF